MIEWLFPSAGGSVVVRGNDAAGERFVAGMRRHHVLDKQYEAAAHETLRGLGVTIVHPDDGWVDRVENSVMFAYPAMMLRPPSAGSLVALGWASKGYRVVRLTTPVPQLLQSIEERWSFVPATMEPQ